MCPFPLQSCPLTNGYHEVRLYLAQTQVFFTSLWCTLKKDCVHLVCYISGRRAGLNRSAFVHLVEWKNAFPHRYSKVKSYLIGKLEIFIWIYCTFRRLDASVIQEMLSVVAPHTNLNQCAANLKAEVLSVSIYNKTGPHKMGRFFCHNNLSVWSVTMLEITVADFCLFVSLCF